MRHHDQPTTTVAILGSETVVGRALCALLEGSGYEPRLLDAYPSGVVDELLDGADLLLLVPGVDEGVREAFLGAMGKNTPRSGDMPVISLSTTATKEGPLREGVLSVPWPCSIEDLVSYIEVVLFVPAASRASTGDRAWPS